jgi:hypothetical protein
MKRAIVLNFADVIMLAHLLLVAALAHIIMHYVGRATTLALGLMLYGARFHHGFCCVRVSTIGLQARFSTEIHARACH